MRNILTRFAAPQHFYCAAALTAPPHRHTSVRQLSKSHDAKDSIMILPNLLNTCAAAIPAAENVVQRANTKIADSVTKDGHINGKALEEHQFAAHGLAWYATYLLSLQQMHKWATNLEAEGKFGELEQLILQISFGEYLWQIWGGIPMSQGEVVRLQDLGLNQSEQGALAVESVQTLTQEGNTQAARSRLVDLMFERYGASTVGVTGLDEELEMIRDQFRRFTEERVLPDAHEWHLKDELIPM